MNKLTKLITGAALASILASPAAAQQSISATLSTHNTSVVRFERSTPNSFGFIDLTGDRHFDVMGIYGQAQINQPLKGALKAGVDVNFGTDFDDRIGAQLAYSIGGAKGFASVRAVKFLTNDSPPRIGYAGAYNLGRVNLSTWGSVDFAKDGVTQLGELEAAVRTVRDIDALVRVEHYPWSGWAVQAGIKRKF